MSSESVFDSISDARTSPEFGSHHHWTSRLIQTNEFPKQCKTPNSVFHVSLYIAVSGAVRWEKVEACLVLVLFGARPWELWKMGDRGGRLGRGKWKTVVRKSIKTRDGTMDWGSKYPMPLHHAPIPPPIPSYVRHLSIFFIFPLFLSRRWFRWVPGFWTLWWWRVLYVSSGPHRKLIPEPRQIKKKMREKFPCVWPHSCRSVLG